MSTSLVLEKVQLVVELLRFSINKHFSIPCKKFTTSRLVKMYMLRTIVYLDSEI